MWTDHDPEEFLHLGNTILISNHQLYIDWLYLWQLSYAFQRAHDFIFILKQSIRKIPFIGRGMRDYGFIFIRRRWEQDQQHLHTSLTDLAQQNLVPKEAEPEETEQQLLRTSRNKAFTKDDSGGFILVMFPEGTTIHPDAMSKSHTFAQTHLGLPASHHPRNVLLPRSTGLWACVKTLGPAGLDSMVDVTVGVEEFDAQLDAVPEDKFPLSMCFFGHPPRRVHLRVDILRPYAPRYDHESACGDAVYETVPTTSRVEFDEWLRESVWRRKESLLEGFRKRKQFEGTYRRVISGQSRYAGHLAVVWGMSALLVYGGGVVLILKWARIF